MNDNIQNLLQHIGELAFNSIADDEWQWVKLESKVIRSYAELDVSYLNEGKNLEPKFILVNDRSLEYSKRVSPSFERLRQLMYEEAPYRGAWYTAVMTITSDGKFATEFEYEEKPKFKYSPVSEAFAQDFEHFPRNEESTPDWLKQIVEQHGLSYHEPEPLI